MDKNAAEVEFEQMLQRYEEAVARVSALPGVRAVEIGLKEKDGRITDELSFRVIVDEKKPAAELAPGAAIPREIEGFPTDVIEDDPPILILGTDSLPDEGKDRPLVGGIQISNGIKNAQGRTELGTLGCIATMNDGLNTRVALSNHHVLFANAAVPCSDAGQPMPYESCCCTCDKIGVVVKGDTTLDCAIARIDCDVQARNQVKEIGDIKGIAAPIPTHRVLKRGRTTGLTSGQILSVNPASGKIVITVVEGRQLERVDVGTPEERIVYGQGATRFAYFGDSGSVILSDQAGPDRHKVVGLLFAIDPATQTEGWAFDINRIVAPAVLNITIHSTLNFGGNTISASTAAPQEVPDPGRTALIALEERLNATEGGRIILATFYAHRGEVLNLITHHRAVKVAWNRKQGPAFTAAFLRSIKHPAYRFPEEIEGTSIFNFLVSMGAVLDEHGSEPLLGTLRRQGPAVLGATARCRCVDDLVGALETLLPHSLDEVEGERFSAEEALAEAGAAD